MSTMTAEARAATAQETGTPTHQRWVVIAPSYNHAMAVGQVLHDLASHHLPIIVVNDGATDDTDNVLDRWLDTPSASLRRVIRHDVNQGKAAALRSGFAEAIRLGFTHAATIDTDGQHEVADLVELIQFSSHHEGSLVIGARSRAGSDAPIASRIGRALSNGLVRIESGVSVADSQSGMRVYPLVHMHTLGGRASRYGFETEVLVRAGWHCVPVIEMPIRCIYRVPGGRKTHFRFWRDTLASIGMHARLLVRAMLMRPSPQPRPLDDARSHDRD